MSGFDSDKSYPLQLTAVPSSMKLLERNISDATDDSASSTYVYTYREPIQPPIRPNYHTYQSQFQQQAQKPNKVTLEI